MTGQQRIEALIAHADARVYRRRAMEAAACVDIHHHEHDDGLELEQLAWAYCIDAPENIPAGSVRGFIGFRPVVRTATR